MKRGITPITEVLGDTPTNKVLDYLMDHEKDCFCLTDIKDGASVRYSTLQLLIPKILERELVFIKKKLGTIKFYQINVSNPFVFGLMTSREMRG